MGNVRRLEISLKMVTARKAHGRVSGYYRNSLKLMQLKKPRFWRGFFGKVQDKFSTMLKTKPKERGPSILIGLFVPIVGL